MIISSSRFIAPQSEVALIIGIQSHFSSVAENGDTTVSSGGH